MKSILRVFVISYIYLNLSTLLANSTNDKSAIVVTAEDIPIKDPELEHKLNGLVKEKGTLTSTRQLDSYILAVLCEYPRQDMKTKPYCSFRKVKIESREK